MTQWGPSETTDIREDTGVTSGTETTHIDRRVSITTSRGPETVYVPQQVDYFEHSATFWRKVERPIFGASVRDLSDEQKKKLETNRGLVVRSLVIDSPAYAADILKDDVILRFDGEGVPSAKRFYEDLLRKAGKTVPVSILRGNKTIEKKVTLNP
jgi:C-terminal processing protease CtpA/Prc